jgi:hypothetical protein
VTINPEIDAGGGERCVRNGMRRKVEQPLRRPCA